MKPGNKVGTCVLCSNWGCLSKHHLIPKALGGKNCTIFICGPCHGLIHKLATIEELKNTYNNIDKLKELINKNE
jgi:hypothetical protein